MHLVDEVHLVATASRRVLRVFNQVSDIIHAGMRGRVQFNQVDETPDRDILTGAAFAARGRCDPGFAVETARQNARNGGFADAAGPGKQIRVMQPVVVQGMHQCFADMLLPHHFVEGGRTEFAVENFMSHCVHCTGRPPLLSGITNGQRAVPG